MFDITGINQPFGTFATAKNARKPTEADIEKINALINKAMSGIDLTDKERMYLGSFVDLDKKINQRGLNSLLSKNK